MIAMTRGTPTLARATAIGSTSAPTKSDATPAVIPQMTATITTSGGDVLLTFSGAFDVRDGDAGTIQFYTDTAAIGGTIRNIAFTGASGPLGLVPGSIGGLPIGMSWLVTGLSAGAHTFDVRWTRSAGTIRAITTQRSFTVIEL